MIPAQFLLCRFKRHKLRSVSDPKARTLQALAGCLVLSVLIIPSVAEEAMKVQGEPIPLYPGRAAPTRARQLGERGGAVTPQPSRSAPVVASQLIAFRDKVQISQT